MDFFIFFSGKNVEFTALAKRVRNKSRCRHAYAYMRAGKTDITRSD